MKPSKSLFPRSVAVATDTGVIPDATSHYHKRLSDLRGLFLDPEALEQRIREENDPVCYYGISYSQAEGDIFFGTTSGPARSRPVTTTKAWAAGACGKWWSSAMACQALKTALRVDHSSSCSSSSSCYE